MADSAGEAASLSGASLSPSSRRAAMTVLAVVLVSATILLATSSEAGLGGAALAEQVCPSPSRVCQDQLSRGRKVSVWWRQGVTSGDLRPGG